MLDRTLKRTGAVLVMKDDIRVEGFDADNVTCRELAALALLWAIGELQKELAAIVERPGGRGICSVD